MKRLMIAPASAGLVLLGGATAQENYQRHPNEPLRTEG